MILAHLDLVFVFGFGVMAFLALVFLIASCFTITVPYMKTACGAPADLAEGPANWPVSWPASRKVCRNDKGGKVNVIYAKLGDQRRS